MGRQLLDAVQLEASLGIEDLQILQRPRTPVGLSRVGLLHEAAAAGKATDELARDELLDGGARGVPAHAELGHDVAVGRKLGADTVDAGGDALLQGPIDPVVGRDRLATRHCKPLFPIRATRIERLAHAVAQQIDAQHQ